MDNPLLELVVSGVGTRSFFGWLLVSAMLLMPASARAQAPIRFGDQTEASGLVFKHENGGTGQRYVIEFMGSGLSVFDYNNDGLEDILLPNGLPLPITDASAADASAADASAADASAADQSGKTALLAPRDHLFLNVGAGRFVDASHALPTGQSNYGLGVTAADYNNDGFRDLYISNFGQNVLLHNNGDGTFTDVTQYAGVADGEQFGAGVTFLDIDLDGDLDLFSGNYLEFTYERHDQLAPNAFPYSPGPRDFPPCKDSLFLNLGDGTFDDISDKSGVSSVAGPSMGVISSDFDQDGYPDVFVVCDGEPNLLYRNQGDETFAEEAVLFGLAYDSRGLANGNMGVELADLTGDDLEDLVVTNYADQLPTQFENLGLGSFTDVTRQTRIGTSVFPHVTWGVGLADFDNDADRDVFIAVGHLLENAEDIDPRTSFDVQNCIMENLANRRFRDVTASAGEALLHLASSRGAGFDDMDNDGDIDCVILNCGSEAQYLENLLIVSAETLATKHPIGFSLNWSASQAIEMQ